MWLRTAFAILLVSSIYASAYAQTSPGWVGGEQPGASGWNTILGNKQDTIAAGGLALNKLATIASGNVLCNVSGSVASPVACPTATTTVATLAALGAVSTVAYSSVIRMGYTAAGDAPALVYVASASACTLHSGAGDGATEVPSSNSKCWLAQPTPAGLDFRQWGAVANANVDTALDDAIAWACSSHLPLNIPYTAAGYRIAIAHTIGNGSSSVNSTCNGITIIGSSIYPEFAVSNGLIFQWYGSAGVIPITVQGPMLGVKMLNIGVDCRGICSTGIKIDNTLDSEFGWLGVRSNIGPAFIITSTPVNIWGGGNEGSWYHDLFAAVPGTGGSGGIIGDTTCNPCTAAVIASRFDGLHWLYDGQTAGTYAVTLGFIAQATITHSRFQRVDNLGALGNSIIIAPPPGALAFPDDFLISHSLIQGDIVEGAGWVPVSGLHFESFPTTYQAFPISSVYGKIWGTDAKGNRYPGVTTWTPTDGSGASLSLTVTDARVYRSGNQCTISFNITYPSTANGAAAQINGIPAYCSGYFGTSAVSGGGMAYTDNGTPMMALIGNGGTTINFYAATGSGFINSGLSTKIIRATLSYLTDSM